MHKRIHEHKLLDFDTVALWSEKQKQEGKSIVFTNGCFDVLHLGHLHLLYRASTFGDLLIVGVNSDTSVRNLKGSNRPLQDQKTRASILTALEYTDAVVVFDEETPEKLIHSISPNVLVKGGDYEVSIVVGADYVMAQGGKVEIVENLPGYSTTRFEKHLRELNH